MATIWHASKPHLLATILLVLGMQIAEAQTTAPTSYLTVDGQVTTPFSLTQAEFRSLPHTSIALTDADGKRTVYSGVGLDMILIRAGVPLKDSLKGADVAKYLHAQGADGFVAIFALPEFDQGTFLVADTQDGAPLPNGAGPLQVISSKEKRHSRWVKGLTLLRIEKASTE